MPEASTKTSGSTTAAAAVPIASFMRSRLFIVLPLGMVDLRFRTGPSAHPLLAVRQSVHESLNVHLRPFRRVLTSPDKMDTDAVAQEP